MEKCMITFRSVTPAQRAEQLLRRAGVRCELHRTPRYLAQQGCGYSLRIQSHQLEQAISFLGSNFDQKEFHKFLLDYGPAPFTLLENYFKNYQKWIILANKTLTALMYCIYPLILLTTFTFERNDFL